MDSHTVNKHERQQVHLVNLKIAGLQTNQNYRPHSKSLCFISYLPIGFIYIIIYTDKLIFNKIKGKLNDQYYSGKTVLLKICVCLHTIYRATNPQTISSSRKLNDLAFLARLIH